MSEQNKADMDEAIEKRKQAWGVIRETLVEVMNQLESLARHDLEFGQAQTQALELLASTKQKKDELINSYPEIKFTKKESN